MSPKAPHALETLEVRRVLSAGVVDPTFGSAGIVLANYRSTNDAIDIAFLPSGKSVVVGDADGGNKDFFIAQFNPDGTPDTTFGSGGVTLLDLGSDEIATSVAVAPDGKILVGGFTGSTSGLATDYFVGRLLPSGTWDTSFAGVGYRTIDLGGLDVAADLSLDPVTGQITLVGSTVSLTGGGIGFARVNSDGSLDTTFGSGGTSITSPALGTIQGAAGMVRVGNAYYVAGFSINAINQHSQMMVAKFGLNGTLITTFGSGGRALASFGNTVELGIDVAVNPANGLIYVGGTSANGTLRVLSPGFTGGPKGAGATSADFAIASFLPSGQLNTAFNGGQLTLDFAGGLDGASGIAVDADGRVVISGGTEVIATGASNFATARYLPTGQLDLTFNSTGTLIQDLGQSDGAFQIRIAPDGKIYLVGHKKGGGAGLATIIRLLSDANAVLPSLVISDASATPTAAGQLTFTVTLTPFSTSPVTVDFATVAGTATAGTDFTAATGTLTFAPGDRTQTVTVAYPANANLAATRNFTVRLTNPANARIDDADAAATLNPDSTAIPNSLTLGTFTVAGLPMTIVGGTKNAKGTATVNFSNTGVTALKGPVTISIYAAATSTLNTASDLLLGKTTVKVSLPAGKTGKTTVKLLVPRVPADTTRWLTAAATGTGVPTPARATKVAANATAILAPVITLNGPTAAQPGVTVGQGKKGTITFTLFNAGNTDALGKLDVDLHITTDGTPATLRYFFFTKKAAANIKAGGSQKFSFPITAPGAPVPGNGLAPGSYILIVKLPSTTLSPQNTTNGTVLVRIPFTLTA